MKRIDTHHAQMQQTYRTPKAVSGDLVDETGLPYIRPGDRPFHRVIDPSDRDAYIAAGWVIAGIVQTDAAHIPALQVRPARLSQKSA